MDNERYASHLALPQFGPAGQQKLKRSHVAIVGLGGIGGPAAHYLAGAGIGRLTLADFDRVAHTNLSRQLLFTAADIGRPKVEAAAARLLECNPAVQVDTLTERVGAAQLVQQAGNADVWIDASDNYATRLACNEAALACRRPWIMAAAIRFEGQLACFRPDLENQPCYRCLYGEAAETLEDCAGAGVLSTVAGTLGLAAAGQAMALLCDLPTAAGLHLYDALTLQWQKLDTTRRADCASCHA